MEEIMKEVLIKVVTGNGPDKVLVVENLPKRFLFTRGPKMRPVMLNGYATEAEVAIPGEFEDILHEGITMSQTGDGGYVFNLNYNDATERFKPLQNYIEKNVSRQADKPEFVSYSQDRTDARSGPIPYSQIPRATIQLLDLSHLKPVQEPVSPSEAQASAQVPAGFTLSEAEYAEYLDMKKKREAAQERMKAARESKLVS